MIKPYNKQLTTASTFHYVGAVALHIYPPDLSGGIFNIIGGSILLLDSGRSVVGGCNIRFVVFRRKYPTICLIQ
jgi:hypothetical protein